MATYEQSNFEQIATAIGVEVGQLPRHGNQFETAALWYQLNRRHRRVSPHPSCATGCIGLPKVLADNTKPRCQRS
jgi:hypothetical protein